MFIDQVRIRVTGGHGGNGCMSFRREKYVPLGGPNGGDGGHGGDVEFIATPRLTSLVDLYFHRHWRGERGTHGSGSDCHGKRGATSEVLVPLGTIVRDLATNEILCDLVNEGQRFTAGKGGRGGKGNPRFVTADNRAPHFAEKGEPGEDREYMVELRIIAEVGLVGLPNAGKSTLLAQVSAAKPKIADYPFTTLSPNLGVVYLGGYRSLTMADIPGLIEGAAEGRGLGHDFLRHIDRTKVLLFMIDLGDPDPLATKQTLEHELIAYNPDFLNRPRFYALNKADVTENRDNIDRMHELFPEAYVISAATGEGIPELLDALWHRVEAVRYAEAHPEEEPSPEREYHYEAPFTIRPTRTGFRVAGARVLRAIRMTDFDNYEAVRHLQKSLHSMGLFRALKRMGAQPGQSIFIDDIELEYTPD